MALIHDNCLWLGTHIPNKEALIHHITNFTYQAEDPTTAFGGKGQDKKVTKDFKKKNGVNKNTQGFVFSEINDLAVKFGTLC